jgi:HEAT repeat protein
MRHPLNRIRRTTRTAVRIGTAALMGLILLAPAVKAAQLSDRTKQGMTLAYGALEDILKDLQSYDFAQGVGALTRLRAYVLAHKDNAQARQETEAGLLRFIQGSPAPGGLMAACRALRLIGGPDSVPVLAALILKPETTDAARFALEKIPGQEAEGALLAALDKSQGAVKRGIVFSLGERNSQASVPALGRLASSKDTVLAGDAVKALGKVGGHEAVQALTSALGKAGPQLRSEVASALLLAAEGFAKARDKAGAAAIYDKLIAASLPQVTRQAAFKRKIETAGDGKDLILKTLAGKDAVLFAPAIAMVPANFRAEEIGQVADLIARLPEDAQAQLTAVLGGYPADSIRPYLLAAAENPSIHVRLAAFRAIEKTGDARAVAFLATKAARTSGAEQDVARETLARVKGSEVDAAILAHLPKTSDEAVKAELVQAASARRVAGAKAALMEMVRSASPALKARAADALRNIATTADIPDLLGLLLGLDDETARETMQDTVAAVARTSPRPLARGGAAEALLAGEKDPGKKASLLRVLGKIGDDSGLPLVRRALSDDDEGVVDAAVRALVDWPTVSARDDLYEIARTSFVFNHRVLSLRTFIRMIGLEPFRSPDGAVADLLRALAVAPRAEEKKLILGMLVRFPCVAGLKTAESLLADPTVAGEAKLAADRIRQALGAR